MKCPPDHKHGLKWKEVPGYDGRYWASSDGRIWSAAKGRELSQSVAGRGYLRVGIPLGPKRTTSGYVHRLVALAFHGLPRPDQEVRHLDGNPKNNNASNLAWGTAVENAADQKRHGTARSQATHCSRGHEFAGNTLWNRTRGRNPFRICAQCQEIWLANSREKRLAYFKEYNRRRRAATTVKEVAS